jgi:hypothetical protein
MPLLTSQSTRIRRDSIGLSGRVAVAGGDEPECPVCGGFLELSQPAPNGDPSELIGACVDCERLSFLVELGGPLTVVVLLPTRDELASAAFGAAG